MYACQHGCFIYWMSFTNASLCLNFFCVWQSEQERPVIRRPIIFQSGLNPKWCWIRGNKLFLELCYNCVSWRQLKRLSMHAHKERNNLSSSFMELWDRIWVFLIGLPVWLPGLYADTYYWDASMVNILKYWFPLFLFSNGWNLKNWQYQVLANM